MVPQTKCRYSFLFSKFLIIGPVPVEDFDLIEVKQQTILKLVVAPELNLNCVAFAGVLAPTKVNQHYLHVFYVEIGILFKYEI